MTLYVSGSLSPLNGSVVVSGYSDDLATQLPVPYYIRGAGGSLSQQPTFQVNKTNRLMLDLSLPSVIRNIWLPPIFHSPTEPTIYSFAAAGCVPPILGFRTRF